MAKPLLVDLDQIDLTQEEFGIEAIRELNLQRYEMEQLNAIIKFDPENEYLVARKDVRDDEFWVRGHIPGRPLFPGVLMIEAAAQACSWYYRKVVQVEAFLGFAGLQDVKFRATVEPGQTLYIIAKNVELKRRRAQFKTQGVVEGKLAFEAHIIGMPV